MSFCRDRPISKLETKSFKFRWEIRNFDERCKSDSFGLKDVESGPFQVQDVFDEHGKDLPRLKVFLHCHIWSEEIGFFVKFEGNRSCTVRTTFRVEDDQGNEVGKINNSDAFATPDQVKKSTTLKLDDAVKSCKTAHVIAEVEFARNVTETKTFDRDPAAPWASEGSSLSDDLKKFVLTKEDADVEIICKGGETIQTYKLLLEARSDVFQAMFQQRGFVENESNRVEIEDVEKEIMELFLDYILSDKVDAKHLARYGDELFAVADKYMVHGLKVICREFIVSKIDVDNCVEYFFHKDEVISAAAKEFLMANTGAVVDTEGWERLQEEEPRLAAELLARSVGRVAAKKVGGF